MAATSEQRRAAVWPSCRFEMSPERWAARLGVEMLRTPRQWVELYSYRMHPPKVAAPDDRPHGQPAGAGPGEAVR